MSNGNILQLVGGDVDDKNTSISHTCNMEAPINIDTSVDFKYIIPHTCDIINSFYIGFQPVKIY